ncbi:MAG TPA: sugar phosphate isomerase/epimerase family protein [Planctomycetota bacterium]|nr:sugar phosphate isomerase/epimerase family protein [Planctomycetota bacterium]
MARFRIGVLADSFRLPVAEGLRKARELGADGVQVYAVGGEVSPESLDRAGRAGFRKLCAGLGLEVSALCGDLGGHGFERAAENPAKVERSRRIVDLAVDLGTRVVTTHVGVIPEDRSAPERRAILAACRELGDYAASRGVTFAIETGPEPAAVLRGLLDDAGSAGVGVNLDPANLAMVTGDDPVAAVATLGRYVVHTHAKDGRKLQACDAREVYGAFADGGFAALERRMGRLFEEVPLGAGSVPWDRYLAALSGIGYRGYLTVEREVGPDPAADIGAAVAFLRARAGGD